MKINWKKVKYFFKVLAHTICPDPAKEDPEIYD